MFARARAPVGPCRLARQSSHWGRECSPAIVRTTPDRSRSAQAARLAPYLDSPWESQGVGAAGVANRDLTRRSRAGPVEMDNVMCDRHLAAAIGVPEPWTAGAAPQFGCWLATSGPPRLWGKDASTLWAPSNGRPPDGGGGRVWYVL